MFKTKPNPTQNLLIPAPVQSVFCKDALDSCVAQMLSQLAMFPVV